MIMDLVMPKMDGAEATVEIKAKSPETKVLLLTSFDSYEGVRRALAAGAEGAILGFPGPVPTIFQFEFSHST